MKRVVQTQLPLELPNGEEFLIEVQTTVTLDRNYGADLVCILNMPEVVKAIQDAVQECDDDMIDAFEEEDEPDDDYDEEDEKPGWLRA